MTAIEKPTRFRRIPTETYAMQFDGDNFDSITAWVGTQRLKRIPSGTVCLWADANRGWMAIEKGEWILQDHAGFYPCKDKVFAGTYARINITADIAAWTPSKTLSPLDPANVVHVLSHGPTHSITLDRNGMGSIEAAG